MTSGWTEPDPAVLGGLRAEFPDWEIVAIRGRWVAVREVGPLVWASDADLLRARLDELRGEGRTYRL